MRNLVTAVKALDTKIDQTQGRLDALRDTLYDLNRDIDEAVEEQAITGDSVEVLNSFNVSEQNAVQELLQSLVTAGVQAVFGSEYRVEVETGIVGGKPVVEVVIVKRGGMRYDAIDGGGGGLSELVSVLFRIVTVVVAGGGVLVLDEPFSRLSGGFIDRLSGVLRELVEQTGIQLILVSHIEGLSASADMPYMLIGGLDGVRAYSDS